VISQNERILLEHDTTRNGIHKMQNSQFTRILINLICVACFLPLFMATTSADDDAAKDGSTAQEAQPQESKDPPSLVAMRKLAHEVKVEILDDNGNVLRNARTTPYIAYINHYWNFHFHHCIWWSKN